ncbi:heterokaryon incompatibility protein-domain-containing protein [Hypoxylon argillaceum]|nr:heterokaryon incompatibility protein-domain-containing protein [Hypoxylon argillaceum]
MRALVPTNDLDSAGLGGGEEKRTYYTALAHGSKEFRLITILAGENDCPVECLLSSADLGDELVPKYETISYCWGDPNDRCNILVNDISLLVPLSAAEALRRVRSPVAPRVVWLDAICINQEDAGERQQQVSLMSMIYQNGDRNLIYLGEEDIEEALHSIDAILNEATVAEGSFTLLRSEGGTWLYSDTGINAAYSVSALFKLFCIPWFRRLWVLQEAALTKENVCLCGSFEFRLLDVTRVAAWLVYKYYFVDEGLRLQCSYAADMNDLVDTQYGYHNTKTGQMAGILYLLDLAQQRLSSLDVDKVYGILGLTINPGDGRPRLAITPDYGRSVAEVYREAAWCILRESGDLQILDYVRHWTVGGELQLDDFASWVPKWHRSKDLDEHPNFMSTTFGACLGREMILSGGITQSDAGLSVGGFRIGRVSRITQRIKADDSVRMKYLESMLDEVNLMVTTPPDSCSLKQAIAVTMVAGVDVRYQPTGPEITGGYEAFRNLGSKETRRASVSSVDDTHDDNTIQAIHYAEAMYNACMNRTFFVTANGHFGLGPHFMKESDVVVILYGLRWPAVLRQLEGNQWLFLGTAYVYGLMAGEMVLVKEAERLDVEFFCIR